MAFVCGSCCDGATISFHESLTVVLTLHPQATGNDEEP